MAAEVAEVKETADHLTRDQLAIAQKWNDGAGTYSPPGHWNDVALQYVRDAKMSEVRAARVFATVASNDFAAKAVVSIVGEAAAPPAQATDVEGPPPALHRLQAQLADHQHLAVVEAHVYERRRTGAMHHHRHL